MAFQAGFLQHIDAGGRDGVSPCIGALDQALSL